MTVITVVVDQVRFSFTKPGVLSVIEGSICVLRLLLNYTMTRSLQMIISDYYTGPAMDSGSHPHHVYVGSVPSSCLC